MAHLLDKPEIIIPANEAADFAEASSTALGQLSPIADYVERSNDLQEDIYTTPTSRGILPAQTGFSAGGTYTPLRVNAASTALTATQEVSYTDGGEIVQFKGLTGNITMDKGFRRATSNYSLTGSLSNTGLMRVDAIFAGSCSIVLDIGISVNIRISRTSVLPIVSLTGFNNVDGTPVIQTSNLAVGQDTSDFAIYVVRFALSHNIKAAGRLINLELARFGRDSIADAMAEGNGYLSAVPGHPNHVLSMSDVTPSESSVPAACTFSVITEEDINTLPVNSYLYDAQIQSGSAFNYFAG